MKATYSLLVVVLYTLYAVSAEDESVKHGKTHYKDGEHDDKYDHEAILGMLLFESALLEYCSGDLNVKLDCLNVDASSDSLKLVSLHNAVWCFRF